MTRRQLTGEQWNSIESFLPIGEQGEAESLLPGWCMMAIGDGTPNHLWY